MNKTFYLKEEDAAVWDRARELADDKLSPVIVTALRKFVAEQEAQINLMDRIEIRYNDKACDGRPTAKAFYGRWLFSPEDPYCPSPVNSLAANLLKHGQDTNIPKLDLSKIDFSKLDIATLSSSAAATKFDFSTLVAEKIISAKEPRPEYEGANRYRKRVYKSAASYNPDAGIGGLGGVLRKRYAVAVSAKGSVVLFEFQGNPESPDGWLWIYSSWEEAFKKNPDEAKPALYEAFQRQGVPVQELDI